MSDNQNNDKEKNQENREPGTGDLMRSVTMAFNMGVAANQSSAHLKSVTEVSTEIGQQIYDNLSKAYGNEYQEEFLLANTEYFLQIALLGYIIPSICSFDNNFKDTLFSLIEARAEKDNTAGGSGSNLETPPDNKIIY